VYKIFIDGQAGTTGLEIHGLLKDRTDLEILEIPGASRKNTGVKETILNEADLVILCLPDDAARESVTLISNPKTRVLDASTAHRTNRDWTYGLPELNSSQRELIQSSKRVSNPGCYPTGYLLAIAPLVRAGILSASSCLSVNAVSGYSGGGRKLIEEYECHNATANAAAWSYRPYALDMNHKHLPEMQHFSGLQTAPLFSPAVGNFHQGMLVQIPLSQSVMNGDDHMNRIHHAWTDEYQNEACIRVHEINAVDQLNNGYLDPEANNTSNRLDLFVFGNELNCQVIARLDNLGKGAGGAAIQNLNLMLGCEELSGLSL
jgi:N-acetyl-gamma-glutamyl-phosphate reductase